MTPRVVTNTKSEAQIPTLDQWGLEVLRFDETSDPAALIDVFKVITHLGDGIVLIALSSLLLIGLLFKGDYRKAGLWVLLVGGTFILSAALKQIFGRARPDEIYHLVHARSPALPSGHALRSTVVYLGGACLCLTVFSVNRGRNIAVIVAGFLAFMIGLSRIALGVHWVTDILAGWAIGMTILWAFYPLLKNRG